MADSRPHEDGQSDLATELFQMLSNSSTDKADNNLAEVPKPYGTSQGRKVLTILIRMENQPIHQEIISEFMHEYIFKDANDASSILDLTYETTYRQLDDFLSYAKSNSGPSNPKVFNTKLKQGGKERQCTQPKCIGKRRNTQKSIAGFFIQNSNLNFVRRPNANGKESDT